MKNFIFMAVLLGVLLSTVSGFCAVRYIEPYIRSDGTIVSGHYRDTSNDGNPYNNANYLGYNNR